MLGIAPRVELFDEFAASTVEAVSGFKLSPVFSHISLLIAMNCDPESRIHSALTFPAKVASMTLSGTKAAHDGCCKKGLLDWRWTGIDDWCVSFRFDATIPVGTRFAVARFFTACLTSYETAIASRCKIGKFCGTAAIPSRAVPCIIGMVRQKLPVRPFRRFRSA